MDPMDAKKTKKRGRRFADRLSNLKCKQTMKPGTYADGRCLYLQISDTSKRWILRITCGIPRRQRDFALGFFPDLTLEAARAKAAEYRNLIRDGKDPELEKRTQENSILTFSECAEQCHAEHARGFRNPKHRNQWLQSIKTYCFPTLADMPIDKIDITMIHACLSDLWTTKLETGSRVRQRLAKIFRWARVRGYRTDNPVTDVGELLPTQNRRRNKKHFKSLNFEDVPQFLIDLQNSKSAPIIRLAFRFLVLTATRTSETRLAKWSEFDLANKLWRIPETRMKMGIAHSIPLSEACIEILRQAKELAGDSEYVFPSGKPDQPLSQMAFLMALRRMEYGDVATTHGFRSSFRMFCLSRGVPREVAEAALAHSISLTAVEESYLHRDKATLLTERVDLMERWAQFCTSPAETKGKVVNFPI